MTSSWAAQWVQHLVGERVHPQGGQRIAIARTCSATPNCGDGRATSLDYETERRWRQPGGSPAGCTVFFITHRLATVRRADLIVVMHLGVVAEVGSHDDLMAKRGRYYALYRQQEAG